MAMRQTRVDLDARAFVRGMSSSTDDIVRRVERHVEVVGGHMASNSQANVPVEMGDLRASMRTKSGRTRLTTSRKTGKTRGGNFFFEVRYTDKAAWFQELGTSEHPPQPYMRPARARAAVELRKRP